MLYFLLLLISFPVIGQEIIKHPELKKEIDSLAQVDQAVQHDFTASFKTGQIEKFEKIKDETFIRHTPILKRIIKQYGYPNYEKVGKVASNNFWLCVQHCDQDLPFQEEVLTLMAEEVKNKRADGRNFAYLTDRVNVNLGKGQVFGTQVTYKDRKAVPKELSDTSNVDKRRAEVGLPPLEEYLKMMTEMHQQMNRN